MAKRERRLNSEILPHVKPDRETRESFFFYFILLVEGNWRVERGESSGCAAPPPSASATQQCWRHCCVNSFCSRGTGTAPTVAHLRLAGSTRLPLPPCCCSEDAAALPNERLAFFFFLFASLSI